MHVAFFCCAREEMAKRGERVNAQCQRARINKKKNIVYVEVLSPK